MKYYETVLITRLKRERKYALLSSPKNRKTGFHQFYINKTDTKERGRIRLPIKASFLLRFQLQKTVTFISFSN